MTMGGDTALVPFPHKTNQTISRPTALSLDRVLEPVVCQCEKSLNGHNN